MQDPNSIPTVTLCSNRAFLSINYKTMQDFPTPILKKNRKND